MTKNTCIIVGGKEFDTGIRVVLWNEEEGLSFYPNRKFHARDWDLEECRKHIKAFYIHHSVTYTAHSTFRGLMARGLSCNFMIDDDIDPETGCATIYQHLDVKDGGWSQGGVHNHDGAGVEICYYPDAWTTPDRYSAFNRKRFGVHQHPVVSDTIHGHKFNKCYGPTDAQVKACNRLAAAYCLAFPDMPRTFPRDVDGKFISTVLPDDKRVGLMHHFNVKRGKIDAMGYPTDQAEKDINKLVHEAELDQNRRRSGVISALEMIHKDKISQID
jgi:hypothetical protein